MPPNISAHHNAPAMAKTKCQETATHYAHEYLEQLLKMEDILGRDIDSRIKETVKRYMDEKLKNSEKKNNVQLKTHRL